ncbi:Hypothetical predicted protein [Mytilus galloprovincialis]|uniref:Uncharacterized protein n=1 Tax=Mytilus galloprovincialis TaxID=29158 RepID=A0A8B6DK87_MYTGA|nr:Hypothetical predicted protein [Mytilus galloprovincialis]
MTQEEKPMKPKMARTVPSKVIYSVCIGCVFIVIIVCGILFKRTRNKRSNPTQKHNKQQNDIQKVQNLELPSKMNMIELESIYDEIDEVSIKVTIVDSSLSKRHTNINSELSSDEISESEHDNIKNEHDEDYLNPYQPIIQDFVKHDYETVRKSFNNIDRTENISHNGNEENSSEKKEQVHECLID